MFRDHGGFIFLTPYGRRELGTVSSMIQADFGRSGRNIIIIAQILSEINDTGFLHHENTAEKLIYDGESGKHKQSLFDRQTSFAPRI